MLDTILRIIYILCLFNIKMVQDSLKYTEETPLQMHKYNPKCLNPFYPHYEYYNMYI